MPSTNPDTTTSELAIIAGTIVPFLVLCLAVLITIILCFVYYRHKHKSGRTSQTRAVPPQEMEELNNIIMTNNASRDAKRETTTVSQNVGKFDSRYTSNHIV